MQPDRRLVALAALMATLLALSGSAAEARRDSADTTRARVVYVTDSIGCADAFQSVVCDGFLKAVKRTGVDGRIVTPTFREDAVDTLGLLAKQRYDAIVVFGGIEATRALDVVAPRNPTARFALIDRAHLTVSGRPRNVQGVTFRTSEAAYLAGWLAARLEARRRGPDVVGVVAGVSIATVNDFVIGFSAGARRASPRIKILTAYSGDFLDASRCAAIARRQVARGAGVLFNVAGVCGLGTLEIASERKVWGIGVDTDQTFLGPHILTSVLKRFDVGFEVVLRQAKARRFVTGRTTVLDLRDDAVGLGTVSRRVPAALRSELVRLERRIARGDIRVPGAYPRR